MLTKSNLSHAFDALDETRLSKDDECRDTRKYYDSEILGYLEQSSKFPGWQFNLNAILTAMQKEINTYEMVLPVIRPRQSPELELLESLSWNSHDRAIDSWSAAQMDLYDWMKAWHADHWEAWCPGPLQQNLHSRVRFKLSAIRDWFDIFTFSPLRNKDRQRLTKVLHKHSRFVCSLLDARTLSKMKKSFRAELGVAVERSEHIEDMMDNV